MNGLFVVGTDTDIGKTIVSAMLMAAAPPCTRYWKPFQTGYPEDCDTTTVQNLTQLPEQRFLKEGVRFRLPASPHHAAAEENSTIHLAPLYEALENAQSPNTTWVVEGVGGLLVPINDQICLPAFIKAINIKCLVVSSTKLGTINHTLLTLAHLQKEKIPTLGVLMVGDEDPSATTGITQHSDIPILGHIPRLSSLTPQSIAACAPLIQSISPIMQALKGVQS